MRSNFLSHIVCKSLQLRNIYPAAREPRCGVHKTAGVTHPDDGSSLLEFVDFTASMRYHDTFIATALGGVPSGIMPPQNRGAYRMLGEVYQSYFEIFVRLVLMGCILIKPNKPTSVTVRCLPIPRRQRICLVLAIVSILALTGCQTGPYEKTWAAFGLKGICMTPEEPERC